MKKGNLGSPEGKLPLYISLGVFASLGVALLFIPDAGAFLKEAWEVLTSGEKDRVRSWVSGFGPYGPLVLIAAMIAQMFLLVIPTILLMVVAILAYGPVWGSLICLAAVAAAGTVGYAIGKFLGENALKRLIGQKTEKKLASFLDDYGFWAVIITRLNPFLSNDAISFVAGLLRMGYMRFMGATLLGILPLILVLAILNESQGPWKQVLLWSSIAASIFLAVYIWWDRKKASKNTRNS